MIYHLLWLSGLAAAQSVATITGKITGADAIPTGSEITYASDISTIIFTLSRTSTGTMSDISSSMATSNGSRSPYSSSSSSTNPLTMLVGGSGSTTLSGNMTVSSTSSSAQPTNTQPCNNYPELCTRKYSNITEVCAHNSPFVVKNNAASNQAFDVTTQLNDGVRMLQGQTHIVNGTMHYCHTSCDLLNAGTVEDYLNKVAAWVADHPYDVITILIGNGDYTLKDANNQPLVTSENYVEPIQNAGLMPYIYQPPKSAMSLDDWPTLGEMIVTGKRVVMFIDYNFDVEKVPWMLWEFTSMWETPYSPTDANFPCTVQRPSGVSQNTTDNWLYMANHNLNVEVHFLGEDTLIPNFVALNSTNAVSGPGSLGLMANQCTADWGRPPNFLLVDFYNLGNFNGSVFEVAAHANNVTYNRKCCGVASFASNSIAQPSGFALSVVLVAAVALML